MSYDRRNTVLLLLAVAKLYHSRAGKHVNSQLKPMGYDASDISHIC